MRPAARILTAGELAVGVSAEFERDVTEEDVLAFAAVSGDHNPLHVDAAYARTTRYQERIAHGAFQIGLASALVGMHLPGRNVLLGSIHARFPSPLYFPCHVVVSGRIAAWQRETASGSVTVVVRDAGRNVPTAEVFLAFTLHERREDTARTAAPAPVPLGGTRSAVLVTGASGGIGAALVERLAADHDVLAIVNRHPLPAGLPGRELHVDLAAPDWAAPIAAVLGDRRLWGIVHAAWPGPPRGGLLQAHDDIIDEQLRFGSLYTVRLARFLFDRVGPEGGRLVVIGSTYGTRQPNLALATYSLGKATLEATLRLLAPELARRQIAVNAVCPDVMPIGMNKHQGERWYATQAAHVPLGRLCRPEDVSDLVRFLLSPGAGYVSGQAIELTGGKL